MAFTNGATRAAMWLPAETGELFEHLLGLPVDAIRTDVPQRPEVWGELCGWYRLAGPRHRYQGRGRVLGAGVEVFARGGELRLRGIGPLPPLFRGFPLRPDDPNDPYVFRVDLARVGVGSIRVAFSRASRPGRLGRAFRRHADHDAEGGIRDEPAPVGDGRRRGAHGCDGVVCDQPAPGGRPDVFGTG